MSARRHEEGAVLLTTLLVMTIMATVAVSLIDDVKYTVKRAANVQAYAQADWYLQGAEDFAQTYLENTIKTVSGSDLNTFLSNPEPITFPFEGGMMQLSVRDGSQCLSTHLLGASQGPVMFRQLVKQFGLTEREAARFTSVAIDWQDVDQNILPDGAEDYHYLGLETPYRTADTAFSSVSEFRALADMNEDFYQRLRPFVCTRPAGSNGMININTLRPEQAPVLASVIGGDDALTVATQLILDRPSGGYSGQEQLLEAPVLTERDNKGVLFDMIAYEPGHVWVEADVLFAGVTRTAVFEFAIDNGRVRRLYRRFGDDARRPLPETKPS